MGNMSHNKDYAIPTEKERRKERERETDRQTDRDRESKMLMEEKYLPPHTQMKNQKTSQTRRELLTKNVAYRLQSDMQVVPTSKLAARETAEGLGSQKWIR